MLEVEDISFGYPGMPPLFKDVSFSVAPGERVQLAAPSGAGKTTLGRVIAGYEKPTQGRVLVDGEPLPTRGVCPVQLIGQHPENALDPRMRMADSLDEAGATPGTPEGERLMRLLGIRTEWLSRYPHELSGGELQRFCIARALAAHPRYLIADEISTMLDAVTQAQIWHALLEEVESHDMGLLFMSHSPALAERIATRIIELPTVCQGTCVKRRTASVTPR